MSNEKKWNINLSAHTQQLLSTEIQRITQKEMSGTQDYFLPALRQRSGIASRSCSRLRGEASEPACACTGEVPGSAEPGA